MDKSRLSSCSIHSSYSVAVEMKFQDWYNVSNNLGISCNGSWENKYKDTYN